MEWDNMEAWGVSAAVVGLFSLFLIFDVLNVGMDSTPFMMRLLACIAAVPIGYVIANNMGLGE